MIYISIGLFGVIGALLRYYIGLSVNEWWVYQFPLGTLLINLIGTFVLGWFTYHVSHMKIPKWFQIGFGMGLISSFTTFSTFSVEMVTLVNDGQYVVAFLYISFSFIGGLICPLLGYRFSNYLKRKLDAR